MKVKKNYDSCVICNEINSIPHYERHNEYGSLVEVGDHIIYKDDDFTIIPSIGPLNEGHVLIVPNVHVIGLCEIDKMMMEKLNKLKLLIRKYNIKYGKVFTEFFEHGTGYCYNSGGSCVAHAHMHVITTNKSIYSSIPKEISFSKMVSYDKILDISNEKCGYLHFEDIEGVSWINKDDILPSQFLRMYYAKLSGTIDKWDWRSHPEYDKVKSVCNYYSKLKEFAILNEF